MSLSYLEAIEVIRASDRCTNRVRITPGIGDQRLIGHLPCGACASCRANGFIWDEMRSHGEQATPEEVHKLMVGFNADLRRLGFLQEVQVLVDLERFGPPYIIETRTIDIPEEPSA
ncbi:MAG: hypothetical protein K0S70_137 [Microbacterium sp.]|jgi:hypothetical protein|nr:hypothetical protein [Microbacterium sp.]